MLIFPNHARLHTVLHLVNISLTSLLFTNPNNSSSILHSPSCLPPLPI
ncbi:hypothetical protein NE237_002286 [Protea cynaroides]|uniref:Uncharacterized protein n=1 Tax=Protea cynaroides TaxID=273540 RepID=A0A9Q0KUY2_9MAGN|nr:hypothetical protein NE237_002286 [Protea cynaroides]